MQHLCEYFSISGVTTHPSFIDKENQLYLDLLKEMFIDFPSTLNDVARSKKRVESCIWWRLRQA